MPFVRCPAHARAARILPIACLVAGLGGCGAEPPAVVRVADAIPRNYRQPSLIDLIEPRLASTKGPRLAVARWTRNDGALDAAQAGQARRFSQDPSVIAVVGHAGSQMTLLASPVYRDAGIPVIIPTATARELRAIPGHFMLAPSDEAVGAFLADAALDSLQGRRVALMHIADSYGEGISRGVVDRIAARGAMLVANSVMTGRECTPDPVAARVIGRSLLDRAHPDVVILALSHGLTACLIRILVAADPAIELITSDSYVPSAHRAMTDAERRAVRALSFWEPGTDSLSRRFVADFREHIGADPEPGQALEYDAFLLVRQAVAEGHVTREGVAKWLRELGTPKHPPVLGVTGPIDFQAPRSAVLHLRHLATPLPPT